MKSQEQIVSAVYEEQQIVWAKSESFPWWPAYVDKIINRNGKNFYRVTYFGDYKHSELQNSQLRKYHQFFKRYSQAKKNNSFLQLSIQQAQKRLVDSQEKKRGSTVVKKPNQLKTPKPGTLLTPFSQPVSQDYSQKLCQSKNTTKFNYAPFSQQRLQWQNNRTGRQQINPQNQSGFQPYGLGLNLNKPQSCQKSEKRDWQSWGYKSKQKLIQKYTKCKIQKIQKFKRRASISRSHEAYIVFINGEVFERYFACDYPSVSQHQVKVQKYHEVKSQRVQGLGQQPAVGSMSMIQQYQSLEKIVAYQNVRETRNGKSYSTGPFFVQSKAAATKKRGRPKKTENMDQDDSLSVPNKTKGIRKWIPSPRQAPQDEMSLKDRATLAKISKLLTNRRALIDYLFQANINIHNISDIVEMGVSEILLNGEVTNQVTYLDELLTTTALHRSFPNHTKIKEKYEQLIRDKSFKPQLEESRKAAIRRIYRELSTNLKDSKQVLQAKSIEIQQRIYPHHSNLGDPYLEAVSKVLQAINDKKQSYEEIIQKLTANGL